MNRTSHIFSYSNCIYPGGIFSSSYSSDTLVYGAYVCGTYLCSVTTFPYDNAASFHVWRNPSYSWESALGVVERSSYLAFLAS